MLRNLRGLQNCLEKGLVQLGSGPQTSGGRNWKNLKCPCCKGEGIAVAGNDDIYHRHEEVSMMIEEHDNVFQCELQQGSLERVWRSWKEMLILKHGGEG